MVFTTPILVVVRVVAVVTGTCLVKTAVLVFVV